MRLGLAGLTSTTWNDVKVPDESILAGKHAGGLSRGAWVDRPMEDSVRIHMIAFGFCAALLSAVAMYAYEQRVRAHRFVAKEFVGRVVGPDGRPVAGARVELRELTPSSLNTVATSSPTDRITSTDEAGRFRLKRKSDCLLYVTKKGFALEPRFQLDQVPDEIEVTLEEGVTFSGRVIDDATNQPIPDALVRLEASFFLRGVCATKTDHEGRFRFDDLPPGPDIAVSCVIAAPNTFSFFADLGESGLAIPDREIRVRMQPILRCRVIDLETGYPVANADVIEISADHELGIARSGADGTFELRGVDFDSSWMLEVRKPGFVGSRREFGQKRTLWTVLHGKW